ncbi:uncharacterized protein METZ01_LOCUS460184, partial [marine metagenome]
VKAKLRVYETGLPSVNATQNPSGVKVVVTS